jgi:hypothetical protein
VRLIVCCLNDGIETIGDMKSWKRMYAY